jgi:hypothetical protein
VLAHALTGAACVQLFERYPLAVTPHAADTGYRSLVLLSRAGGPPSFFVLTQASDDLFVIRSWHRGGGVNQQIRPGEPVPVIVRQVVTGGIPVPRDGTLLGWVTGRQVTVMLATRSRQPETWDDPVPVPEIRVLPMAGTCEPLHWPPFAAGPLDDGRLWEYVERGQIVDVGPLLSGSAGSAFWVPSADRRSARHEDGCIVVIGNLPAEEYWLAAGVYTDHWMLREGIMPLPAGRLLAQPGVVDMAGRR